MFVLLFLKIVLITQVKKIIIIIKICFLKIRYFLFLRIESRRKKKPFWLPNMFFYVFCSEKYKIDLKNSFQTSP